MAGESELVESLPPPERQRELVAAFQRTLRWTTQNAAELLENRPTWIRLVKRLAELAMLSNAILDHHLGRFDPELEADARRWLELVWQRTRRGDLFAEALAMDPVWTSFAMTYAELRPHGLVNERLEQLLVARAHEAPQEWFVQLANACAYRTLDLPSRYALDALVAEAWCVRIPHFQIADVGRMYETTHVIMWVGAGGLPDAARQRLQQFIPRWIEHYREVKNPDLVAELIVAAHRLGGRVSDETWTWLLALQTEDGSLREMDSPTRVLGRWHVTFAFALAIATAL